MWVYKWSKTRVFQASSTWDDGTGVEPKHLLVIGITFIVITTFFIMTNLRLSRKFFLGKNRSSWSFSNISLPRLPHITMRLTVAVSSFLNIAIVASFTHYNQQSQCLLHCLVSWTLPLLSLLHITINICNAFYIVKFLELQLHITTNTIDEMSSQR